MATTYENFTSPVMAVGSQPSATDEEGNSRPKYIVAAGGGGSAKTGVLNRVNLYELKTHEKVPLPVLKQLSTFETGSVLVGDMALAPDASLLVCGILGGPECRIYQFQSKSKTFQQVESFETDFDEKEAEQNVVTFNASSDRLATGGNDGVVRVWKVAKSGTATAPVVRAPMFKELTGHTGPIQDVCFHPNGSLVLSCSGDGTMRIWQLLSGKTVCTMQGYGEAAQAGTGGSVERRKKKFGRWVYSAARFSPDGNAVYALERSFRGPACVVKFVRQGDKWESTPNPKAAKVVTINKTPVGCMNMSTNGRFLGFGTGEGEVIVYSTRNLTKYLRRMVHKFPVTGVTFQVHEDQPVLVSGSMDKVLAVTPVIKQAGLAEAKWLVALVLVVLLVVLLFVQFVV